MPVEIHGKQYVTVAERVKEAGPMFKSLNTEVLQHSPLVVIKATVTTDRGVFTGISGANPAKAIEKMSPYEVAETSAVGRALGFAGYGVIDSIATADEMNKVPDPDWITADDVPDKPKTPSQALGVCPKCSSQMIIGRNGKPYCKPCYIKWAEEQKSK